MADDLAKLGVVVQGQGINETDRALGSLERRTRHVEGATQSLQREYRALNRTAGLVKGVLAGVFSGAILRNIGQQIDGVTQMRNRLQLYTATAQAAARAQRDIFEIAQDTGTVFEDVGELYARTAQGAEELGLRQTELLEIVETTTQSFIISGAAASESTAAVRQFAQALASGELRGDEFRSITENAPRLARAIADATGNSIGSLRDMAYAGELTSDVVVEAILSMSDEIQSEFDSMDVTIGRSATRFANSAQNFIAAASELTGIGRGVSGAFSDAAAAIDRFALSLDPSNLENYSRYLDLEIERLEESINRIEGRANEAGQDIAQSIADGIIFTGESIADGAVAAYEGILYSFDAVIRGSEATADRQRRRLEEFRAEREGLSRELEELRRYQGRTEERVTGLGDLNAPELEARLQDVREEIISTTAAIRQLEAESDNAGRSLLIERLQLLREQAAVILGAIEDIATRRGPTRDPDVFNDIVRGLEDQIRLNERLAEVAGGTAAEISRVETVESALAKIRAEHGNVLQSERQRVEELTDALIESETALERQTSLIETLRDLEDDTANNRILVEHFGATDEAIEGLTLRYEIITARVREFGSVTDDEVAAIDRAIAAYTQQATLLAQLDRLREEGNDTLEAGQRLTEEHLSPLERYNARIAETQRLMSARAIDITTFYRELGAAREELEDALDDTRIGRASDALGDGFAKAVLNARDLDDLLSGILEQIYSIASEELFARPFSEFISGQARSLLGGPDLGEAREDPLGEAAKNASAALNEVLAKAAEESGAALTTGVAASALEAATTTAIRTTADQAAATATGQNAASSLQAVTALSLLMQSAYQASTALQVMASSASTSSVASLFPSARGNVFLDGAPQFFDRGGVIPPIPTRFSLGGGRQGIAGEGGGYEGILPLKRGGPRGELGVAAFGGGAAPNWTTEIHFHGASEKPDVQRTETSRGQRIDVMLREGRQNDIQSGRDDGVMRRRFGLTAQTARR